MKVFDDKFKSNKRQYILQCLMATVALLIVMTYVNYVVDTVIVASLGATSFILFTMPHTHSSKPRYIIGGYFIASVVGVLCSLLIGLNTFVTPVILGAIAVGLCMFLMVILNFEHPPAAGFALGIVIDGFDVKTILFVYFMCLALILFTYLNKKWFIDLL